MLTLLKQSMGNVEERIEHHLKQLREVEYFLLVAGNSINIVVRVGYDRLFSF